MCLQRKRSSDSSTVVVLIHCTGCVKLNHSMIADARNVMQRCTLESAADLSSSQQFVPQVPWLTFTLVVVQSTHDIRAVVHGHIAIPSHLKEKKEGGLDQTLHWIRGCRRDRGQAGIGESDSGEEEKMKQDCSCCLHAVPATTCWHAMSKDSANNCWYAKL